MEEEARAALDGHVPEAAKLPAVLGRPSTYSKDMAEQICDMLAKRITLDEIGRMPGFPGRSTIYRWINENPEFKTDYAIALQWRSESYVDQMVEIALDSSGDTEIVTVADATPDGPPVGSITEVKDSVKRSALAIKTLQYKVERGDAKKHFAADVLYPPAITQGNGDGAKEINPRGPMEPLVIDVEPHPLDEVLAAAARAAKAPLPNA